ncbi:HNH endonuclease [Nonomuraea sp. NPDC049028]|uniref:HNH endonuclease n=1 Tax=Nonomuraea sp. NPDC049028 TaxID=3364348 RepID=UPI00371FEC70
MRAVADPNRNGKPYRDLRERLKGSHRGATCHICQKPIDMTLAWPDKMSWSMDHLVPLSLGGKNVFENVASSHLSCNSRRGKEILGVANRDADGRWLGTRDW